MWILKEEEKMAKDIYLTKVHKEINKNIYEQVLKYVFVSISFYEYFISVCTLTHSGTYFIQIYHAYKCRQIPIDNKDQLSLCWNISCAVYIMRAEVDRLTLIFVAPC